tara:strand:- start:3382 stop:4662 length:1281 start_codon:yes stop_codon:yes gene_type:complete
MKSFSFVHAADLHLDSQFRGVSEGMPSEIKGILRDSTFKAFQNIVDFCIEKNVDALLIAGDIFDSANRSFKAQWEFKKGINKLASKKIKSFICHGNHDPLDGWEGRIEFPEEYCFKFGDVPSSYSLFDKNEPDVKIHGYSYPTREIRKNIIPQFGKLVKGGFNIGLIHANVDNDPKHDPYAPCSSKDLVNTGYDYWALGHVHTRKIVRDHKPFIVYPGNTQGRHVNEPGPRGIIYVNVDEMGEIDTEFVSIDIIRFESIEITCEKIESINQLESEIKHRFGKTLQNAKKRHVIVELKLIGSTVIDEDLKKPDFELPFKENINEEFGSQSPFLWCANVKIATTAMYNRDELINRDDFIGELVRLNDKIRTDDREFESFLQDCNDIYAKGSMKNYLNSIDEMDKSVLYELILESEQHYLPKLLEDELL